MLLRPHNPKAAVWTELINHLMDNLICVRATGPEWFYAVWAVASFAAADKEASGYETGERYVCGVYLYTRLCVIPDTYLVYIGTDFWFWVLGRFGVQTDESWEEALPPSPISRQQIAHFAFLPLNSGTNFPHTSALLLLTSPPHLILPIIPQLLHSPTLSFCPSLNPFSSRHTHRSCISPPTAFMDSTRNSSQLFLFGHSTSLFQCSR
jgi:hypothetical protein